MWVQDRFHDGRRVAERTFNDGRTPLSREGKPILRGVGVGGFAELVITPASGAVKAAYAQSSGTISCGSSNVVCAAETSCPANISGNGSNNVEKGCLYAKANGYTTSGRQALESRRQGVRSRVRTRACGRRRRRR